MLRVRLEIMFLVLFGLAMPSGCSNEIVWRDPVLPTGAYVPGQSPAMPTVPTPVYQNPALIRTSDHEFLWETIADVIDDYFKIKEEKPVQLVGQDLTGGLLTTFPEVGSTIFEPWRRDSVGTREKLECTLQSIRRTAEVRVTPDGQGYFVEVVVYKELEDLRTPGNASAGQGTFRYDSTLTRVTDSLAPVDANEGWIRKGRDPALEQQILSQIVSRTASVTYR